MDIKKVAIHEKNILAATNDTIYLWQKLDLSKVDPIRLETAEKNRYLGDITITCLRIFDSKAIIGTKCGNLIIVCLETMHDQNKKPSKIKLSKNKITSIRLSKGDNTLATICFNQETFIQGELEKNSLLDPKFICRDHSIRDARYVNVKGDKTSQHLITVGPKYGLGAYMQTDKDKKKDDDDEQKKSRPIYYDDTLNDWRQDILDISDEGLMLVNDREGMIYLRHHSDDRIKIHEPIGDSLVGNGIATGLLVSFKVRWAIVHAGEKKPELAITTFSLDKELEMSWGWEGRGKVEGKFIPTMDHYQHLIVLGFRRSILVFELLKNGLPEEPDKLANALNNVEAEHSVPEGSTTKRNTRRADRSTRINRRRIL